jgi:hypothetical protein
MGSFCFIKFKNHIEFLSATETMAVRREYKYMMVGSRSDTFFKWNIGDIDVPAYISRYETQK